MSVHLIVLAAGEGTRMASDLPKVLHEIAGAPMVAHTLATADGLDVGQQVVVIGHAGEEVKTVLAAMDPEIEVVEQTERQGTAHAVTIAADALADANGDVAIMNGDNPLITPETLAKMIQARADGADLVVLGLAGHHGLAVLGLAGLRDLSSLASQLSLKFEVSKAKKTFLSFFVFRVS